MRQQRPLGPLPQPSSAHATAQDLWVEGEALAVAETRVRGSKRRLDAGAREWLHGGLVAEVQSGREGSNRVSVKRSVKQAFGGCGSAASGVHKVDCKHDRACHYRNRTHLHTRSQRACNFRYVWHVHCFCACHVITAPQGIQRK